jgi:NADH-quinone oxidoreductase subunit N
MTLVFVMLAEITYHEENRRLTVWTSLMGLFAAGAQILLSYHFGPSQAFSGTLSVDALAQFIKLIAIILAAVSILISEKAGEIDRRVGSEYIALIFAGTLALCFIASATNLFLISACLALLFVVCFFLAGYKKQSVRSSEASIKFFVMSSVFLGLFLFGVAILFAFTHSLSLSGIHQALEASSVSPPVSTAALSGVFILLLLGLLFTIGTFPAHFWTPDVLEGAPTPASGYLAIAPRLAGFAVLIRLFFTAFSTVGGHSTQGQVLGGVDWTLPVAIVAGASMIIGSLLAYRQKSGKRLVASLAIANTGALLMGLITLDEVGVSSILYSLWIELFSILGIFFVLSLFVDALQSDELSKFRGTLMRALPESVCLLLFLFCFIGFPPFPGFIGRFALIGSVVRHQEFALAGICIFSTAVSAAAVVRLAFSLIGDSRARTSFRLGNTDHSDEFFPTALTPFRRRLFLALMAVPLLFSSIFAQALFDWAGRSLGSIFW